MFCQYFLRRKRMKIRNLRLLPVALLAVVLVIGYALPGYGAHTGGAVILKDQFGTSVTGSVPYSPKTTCGTTSCHDQYGPLRGLNLSNIYESNTATATKTHDGVNYYDVPYPQQGVTAGYHFQQGRNVSWDATQKSFYGVPKFTSSPGMYGKY
jgi:hypothetical protein